MADTDALSDRFVVAYDGIHLRLTHYIPTKDYYYVTSLTSKQALRLAQSLLSAALMMEEHHERDNSNSPPG